MDLVERRSNGELRVTDHKTGKASVPRHGIIHGGTALQPVLYALATEKLFAGQNVVAGRLNYCTAAGGFEARIVPLDDRARRAAELVANTVGQALDEGFLPAAPADGACRFCDYRVVCGPYEELRSRRKPKAKLAGLRELRNTP
jgi:CRISPR/Cas system-associated exonuclease Cas4 (RecB family)